MRTSRLGQSDCGLVADQITALLSELVPDHAPDRRGLEATAREVLAFPTVTGFAAWEESQPIGLILLNDCAAIYAGGRFGEITELYVAPPHRSAGVAAALVACAVEEGRARGWQRLEVGAPGQPQWVRTVQFYLREGFTEVGPRLRRLL